MPPGQPLSPCEVKAAQETGTVFPRLPELGRSTTCGGCEGNLGLEQAAGLQAATLLGELPGAGDPAKATRNSLNPAKAKGAAKRKGCLRDGCFVAGEGRKYFGGSVCSQRSTVGTL